MILLFYRTGRKGTLDDKRKKIPDDRKTTTTVLTSTCLIDRGKFTDNKNYIYLRIVSISVCYIAKPVFSSRKNNMRY